MTQKFLCQVRNKESHNLSKSEERCDKEGKLLIECEAVAQVRTQLVWVSVQHSLLLQKPLPRRDGLWKQKVWSSTASSMRQTQGWSSSLDPAHVKMQENTANTLQISLALRNFYTCSWSNTPTAPEPQCDLAGSMQGYLPVLGLGSWPLLSVQS